MAEKASDALVDSILEELKKKRQTTAAPEQAKIEAQPGAVPARDETAVDRIKKELDEKRAAQAQKPAAGGFGAQQREKVAPWPSADTRGSAAKPILNPWEKSAATVKTEEVKPAETQAVHGINSVENAAQNAAPTGAHYTAQGEPFAKQLKNEETAQPQPAPAVNDMQRAAVSEASKAAQVEAPRAAINDEQSAQVHAQKVDLNGAQKAAQNEVPKAAPSEAPKTAQNAVQNGQPQERIGKTNFVDQDAFEILFGSKPEFEKAADIEPQQSEIDFEQQSFDAAFEEGTFKTGEIKIDIEAIKKRRVMNVDEKVDDEFREFFTTNVMAVPVQPYRKSEGVDGAANNAFGARAEADKAAQVESTAQVENAAAALGEEAAGQDVVAANAAADMENTAVFTADGAVLAAEAGAIGAERDFEQTQSFETADIEEPVFENDEAPVHDDYEHVRDRELVADELRSMRVGMVLRMFLTAAVLAFSLYLTLAPELNIPVISALAPAQNPLYYLIANAAALALAALLNIGTVWGGLIKLFGRPSADSLTAVAVLAGAVQIGVAMVSPATFAGTYTLFAPIAIAGLLTNTLGALIRVNAIVANFADLADMNDMSAAYILKDERILARIAKDRDMRSLTFLISRPVGFYTSFLKHSFSPRKSDKAAKIFAWLQLLLACAAAGYSYYLTKELSVAVTSFAAAACLCAPLAVTLTGALPLAGMHRAAAKVGAVIPGYSSIYRTKAANAVLINAKNLLPAAAVKLHGIKTFEKERIDLAILYAASVLIEGSDTLGSLFMPVIENNTSMLYKVENMSTVYGMGFSAWVENSRVLVGNRELMNKYGVRMPSLEYEQKYTKGERSPIYLAVSGSLFAMFIVSYTADEKVTKMLRAFAKNGTKVVVEGNDFNAAQPMLTALYGLPDDLIYVLEDDQEHELAHHTAFAERSDESAFAHAGTFESFMGGFKAAYAAAAAEKVGFILQFAGMVFCAGLTVLFTLTKGLSSLSLLSILSLLLAWLIPSILPAIIKRY